MAVAVAIAAESNFNDCIGLLNYYESIAFCFVSLRSHTHSLTIEIHFRSIQTLHIFTHCFLLVRIIARQQKAVFGRYGSFTISFSSLARQRYYINSFVFHI